MGSAPLTTALPYICSRCENRFPRYSPECPSCGRASTLRSIEAASRSTESRPRALALTPASEPIRRFRTGLGTLDLALGRNHDDHSVGMVFGASYILTGAPGAGKSTLGLLIAEAAMPYCLYVAAEGSERIWRALASRTGRGLMVPMLYTKNVAYILAEAESSDARVIIVDQLHALEPYKQALLHTRQLVQFAEASGRTVVLIAERSYAGNIRESRSIPYAVDCTISLEKPAIVEGVPPPPSDVLQQRWLTTSKNRHGPDGSWSLLLGERGWAEVPPAPPP
jgi:predicted ATP-dependent serine protease